MPPSLPVFPAPARMARAAQHSQGLTKVNSSNAHPSLMQWIQFLLSVRVPRGATLSFLWDFAWGART